MIYNVSTSPGTTENFKQEFTIQEYISNLLLIWMKLKNLSQAIHVFILQLLTQLKKQSINKIRVLEKSSTIYGYMNP